MFVYFAKVVKNLAVLLTKIVKRLTFLALFVIFTPLILLLGILKVKGGFEFFLETYSSYNLFTLDI